MGVDIHDVPGGTRGEPYIRALCAALHLTMVERDLAKAQRDELAATIVMCRVGAAAALRRAGFEPPEDLDVEPVPLLTEDQVPR